MRMNDGKIMLADGKKYTPEVISYNNFEGKDDYEADIKLYNRLLEEGHMSPMEHCAKSAENGNWYNNFKGFIQLRKEIEWWIFYNSFVIPEPLSTGDINL